MKILLINYEFPPLGGGAGNATQNIARELARAGHSVLVLTTWFPGCAEDEMVDEYRVFRVTSRRKRVDRSGIFEMLDFVWKTIVNGGVSFENLTQTPLFLSLPYLLVSSRGTSRRH